MVDVDDSQVRMGVSSFVEVHGVATRDSEDVTNAMICQDVHEIVGDASHGLIPALALRTNQGVGDYEAWFS